MSARECGMCHGSAAWRDLNSAGLCRECWESLNWFSGGRY